MIGLARVPDWLAGLLAGFAALAAVLVAPPAAQAGEAAVKEVQRAAYAADFRAGIANLDGLIRSDRGDVEAVFGKGTLQVLDAFGGLQEGLYRHSTAAPPASLAGGGISPLAMLGFGLGFGGPSLLPPNPQATPMTYKALRTILARFVDDLAKAEVTLAAVGDRPVKLPLQPFEIALDLNHDGRIDPHERLIRAFFGRSIDSPTFAFDTADASWLRGYAHVLMASTNLLLACDFEKSYEAVGHNLYGLAATALGRETERQMRSSRSPAAIQGAIDAVAQKLAALRSPVQAELDALRARLNALPRTPESAAERRTLSAEMARLNQQQSLYYAERSALEQERQQLHAEQQGQLPGASYAQILDLIAAIHAIDWPVVEPARLKAVRGHLLQVMALNRNTWRLARAETDDDREWLPNPRQTSFVTRQAVTDEVIDSWLATTALAEQVLKGEKLLPHPRFRQGVDLKLLLETAKRVDLVMMVTGHGLVPYLKDGDTVDARAWREITRPMQQNFWMFAAWFN